MTFDKNNPFYATIAEREVLSKHGSQKCTLHLSLDISGSHFKYNVGDSIAVHPKNSPTIVKETLKALKATGHEHISDPRDGTSLTLNQFLSEKANLTKVTKKWVQSIFDHTTNPHDKQKLEHLLNPDHKDEFKLFCEERQLWDFLNEFPNFDIDLNECLHNFSPLLPRFYSIASSQLTHPNRIDLLVAYFKYMSNHHLRHGVASHYLCELAPMHQPIAPIYIHPSRGFSLPTDKSIPIIMIGPGTGVAPYRGFMQERVATGASGKNWLFFGEWNEAYDFYYQDYWKDLEQQGHLKLSLAFSRDHQHKVYVQHKMLEEASLVWKWLEQKAIVYVCGDATHMAKDVDLTLHHIIEKEGNKSPEEASHYIKMMKEESRYLRDVY